MTRAIRFGVWAPDQATFWQSWANAGIIKADGVVTAEQPNGAYITPIEYEDAYQGISTTADTWNGQVVKVQAVLDVDGTLITPAVMVSGWHCNVIVYGEHLIDPTLQGSLTYGLDQHDEDGNLKSIWDRTWADLVFSLTEQAADPSTGFPAGYRNATGVTYCDPAEFSSPSNIIL